MLAGQLFGFPFPYYINCGLPGTPQNKYSMRINEDYLETDELSSDITDDFDYRREVI